MKIKSIMCISMLSILVLSGCASGLNSKQKFEYQEMQADNVLVEEKNPTAGALFGLLPGGGSFYAREPGWGVVNLLMWPLSILWDPVSGYEGSQAINYHTTKQDLKRSKEDELNDLDEEHAAGKLDVATYDLRKKQISKKYDYR